MLSNLDAVLYAAWQSVKAWWFQKIVNPIVDWWADFKDWVKGFPT
jgi:hypothetical protein